MHRENPPEGHEPSPHDDFPAAERRRRAESRNILRAMLKEELLERPLTARKRREFRAFARQLGLDDFEARLFIRAVEYECGHVPRAAMEESQTAADLRYVSADRETAWQGWMTAAILVAMMVMFLILDLTIGR